ncbi:MAG: hypothetical protein QGG40_11415, partial [Myxococcota bacterium]|nr:hypothetical protein [Myxococcota bacterium]
MGVNHRSWMATGLACLGILLAVPATAQTPQAEDTAPSTELLSGSTQEVRTAASTWEAAWRNTPRLVSLQTTESATGSEALEQRLKLLGSKTFSNREWKDYWKRQAETGENLRVALTTAADTPSSHAAAMEQWVKLAESKVNNQDLYFNAIEAERDAVEERLEATLEGQGDAEEDEARPQSIELPNPYERRQLHLADLEQRIEVQKQKRILTESEIRFIERQLGSEETLGKALEKDVVLAEREHDIATGQARGPAGAWQALWEEISLASSVKVDKISAEARHGQVLERGRQVELGLAQSQLRFRDDRIS